MVLNSGGSTDCPTIGAEIELNLAGTAEAVTWP
jgi:hypothetical protein